MKKIASLKVQTESAICELLNKYTQKTGKSVKDIKVMDARKINNSDFYRYGIELQ